MLVVPSSAKAAHPRARSVSASLSNQLLAPRARTPAAVLLAHSGARRPGSLQPPLLLLSLPLPLPLPPLLLPPPLLLLLPVEATFARRGRACAAVALVM